MSSVKILTGFLTSLQSKPNMMAIFLNQSDDRIGLRMPDPRFVSGYMDTVSD